MNKKALIEKRDENKMSILLVEDDLLLGEGLCAGLVQYQYKVVWAKDGEKAWEDLQTDSFDIVILDLGLPKLSGKDVLKKMRSKKMEIPVIILTAFNDKEDLIRGLDLGADDYVVKPFSLEEICARIRAILRRKPYCIEPNIIVGDIVLDPTTRLIFKSGKKICLARREFMLMRILMENVGHVLTKERIMQEMYGWGDNIDSNALEVHIHTLRKKIGGKAISTIRGVGYKLEKPKNRYR